MQPAELGGGLVDRGDDRLHLRMHAELREDVADVPVDGLLADGESEGNFLVRLAAREQAQDIDLAVGE